MSKPHIAGCKSDLLKNVSSSSITRVYLIICCLARERFIASNFNVHYIKFNLQKKFMSLKQGWDARFVCYIQTFINLSLLVC